MEASKDVCPICLEGNLSSRASTVQPCDHTFCVECITKWTAQNPTCPLCLKTIDTITKKIESLEAEDSKEDVIIPTLLSKKPSDEEFECFDHQYFVKEYKSLVKKIQEAEFSLKSQIGIRRRKLELEKNYQMALHMKQEVEMKINFLGRVQKISPRDLLEDIQHFCDLLKKINSSEKSYSNDFEYTEDVQYDDEDYYNQGDDYGIDNYSVYSIAVTKTTKTKKKNKGKAKNKKDILDDSDSTTVITN